MPVWAATKQELRTSDPENVLDENSTSNHVATIEPVVQVSEYVTNNNQELSTAASTTQTSGIYIHNVDTNLSHPSPTQSTVYNTFTEQLLIDTVPSDVSRTVPLTTKISDVQATAESNSKILTSVSTSLRFSSTIKPNRKTPKWGIPTQWPHYVPDHILSTTVKPKSYSRFREFDWLYCPTLPTSSPHKLNTIQTALPLSTFEATFSPYLEENSKMFRESDNVAWLLGIGILVGE